MKISTQPYKGARDFYPEDKRTQKWLFDTWRQVAERYGYEEYDAPILEPTDLFLMKGNEEIIAEQTYTFTDRGDRSVTIRTEMTPTVSRMIAGRRQELAYPARWYSIPNLWRYERMQRGRLREFWQLNIDMFGVAGIEAEIEMLRLADDLFQAFSAKRSSYVIKVNSRELINYLLGTVCGLNEEQCLQTIRAIDKKDKIDATLFKAMIAAVTNDEVLTDKIITVLKYSSLDMLPVELKQTDAYQRIEQVIRACQQKGLHNIVFDINLMRGFDYYTDIVFEAFDTDPDNSRALLGGGRYDGLVGQFGVEPIPTIGFAAGDVGFMNFLQTHKLVPDLKPQTEVLILVRDSNSSDDVQQAADELREMGVNIAVDYSGKKLDKQFKNALKTGVPYIVFVGEEDTKSAQYVLKEVVSGKEEKHSLQRIVSIVKDSRKK